MEKQTDQDSDDANSNSHSNVKAKRIKLDKTIQNKKMNKAIKASTLNEQKDEHNSNLNVNSNVHSTSSFNESKEKQVFLSDLNPFLNEFLLKFRIIFKSAVKRYSFKGENKSAFYLIVMDKNNEEMKLTFYQTFCFKFLKKIKIGKSYSIKNAQIKASNNCIFNQYELVCQHATEINQLKKKAAVIEDQVWNPLKSISEINASRIGKRIDIFGMVMNVIIIKKQKTKSGREIDRMTFDLIDSSSIIQVTAWDEHTKIAIKERAIIGIKHATVGDWNALSLTVSGFLVLNPKHALADAIRDWKKDNNDVLDEILMDILRLSVKKTNNSKMNVADVYKKVKDFARTKTFPKVKFFTLQANIKSCDPKMWYKKQNHYHWRLLLFLSNVSQNTKVIQSICFEKAAANIFKDFTADEAEKMKKDQPEKFASTMLTLLDPKNTYIFHCHFETNNHFGKPILEVIADRIILLNDISERKNDEGHTLKEK